jgi:hypothetical protein
MPTPSRPSRKGFVGGYHAIGWRYWDGVQVDKLQTGYYLLRSNNGEVTLLSIEWRDFLHTQGNYKAVVSDDGIFEIKTRKDIEFASGFGDSIAMWYGPIQLPAGYQREKFLSQKDEGQTKIG